MKDLTEQIYDELNAQVVRMLEHSLAQASRIADLERQIAEASAPAVEQQPVARLTFRDLPDDPFDIVIFDKSRCIDGMNLYAAPQAADTDKVREESQIRKARDLTLDYAAMHFDAKNGRMVNSAYVVEYLRELKEAPLDASVIVGTSMAGQAPVREVPEGWIPISERLPELYQTVALLNDDRWMNTGNDDFNTNWHGAGWLAEFGQKFWSVIGETRSMTLDSVTHWAPLPASPVQQEGEKP